MEYWMLAVIVLFTVTAMLAVGLETEGDDVVSAFRERALLGRAALAVIVIVPVMGWLVTRAVSLEPHVEQGIVLMTIAPGAAFALQFTRRVGRPAFAAALQFLFSALALVITPALTHWLFPDHAGFHERPGRLLLLLAAVTYLPLVAGFTLRRRAPALARKLRGPVSLVSTLSFLLAFIVLARPMKAEARAAVGTSGVLVIIGLVLASMLVGWLLGGPDRRIRSEVATHASVRNVGIALLIAHEAFDDPLVASAVITYAALMIPPNFVMTMFVGRSLKRGARATPDPDGAGAARAAAFQAQPPGS